VSILAVVAITLSNLSFKDCKTINISRSFLTLDIPFFPMNVSQKYLMHNSLVLSFLFFTFALAQEQEILNQCFPVPGGSLCVTVTSYECFQLTGTVKWNDLTVLGPQSVPIGTILNAIQDRLDDPNRSPTDTKLCQTLQIGPASCSLCASDIDTLRIDGSNLHYCGNLSVNCTAGVFFPPTPTTFLR